MERLPSRSLGNKHQESEHGFMGCQLDTEETVPGDPDSQIVCVNKVGTFGLSPASYWWTRISPHVGYGLPVTGWVPATPSTCRRP